MFFDTIVGYPVTNKKIKEQAKRIGIDITKGGYLGKLGDVIKHCGCPIVGFGLQRKEDRKDDEELPFIMTIYEGSRRNDEINVKEILAKFPPIFETIKRDLGVTGEPQFYLGEP